MNAIGLELDDDVLQNASPCVLGFLLVQVVGPAGPGNFDHQLRSTDDVTPLDS